MEVVLLTYLLTILIPINGLILLGIRYQRLKNRGLLMAMWKLHNRRSK